MNNFEKLLQNKKFRKALEEILDYFEKEHEELTKINEELQIEAEKSKNKLEEIEAQITCRKCGERLHPEEYAVDPESTEKICGRCATL